MPYEILPVTTTTAMNNSNYNCRFNSNNNSPDDATSTLLKNINNKHTPSSAILTNNAVNFTSSLSDSDISKHLESLRARLGLARFKMNQGWESSTFGDVQQLWKKRQQRLIDELPKPRFTQRDIIDKRVYIPSPGAKHAKTKKARLTRALSSPITSNDFHQHQYHLKRKKNLICSQEQQSSSAEAALDAATGTIGHCSRSRRVTDTFNGKRSFSISSPISTTLHSVQSSPLSPELPQPPVRNSLDFLSYAIAMTENNETHPTAPLTSPKAQYSSQPLRSTSPIPGSSADEEDEPTPMDTSVAGISTNNDEMDMSEEQGNTQPKDEELHISPPSSPTTTAAKAILMFNSNNDEYKQYHRQRSDSSELSISYASQA
ncbi:hypothetical protein BDF20DRAFT_875222 [Mycotypha africana]|uniref:uncharacterized protein n=1 Tax=Mycotypha africana TaxID=64632 RepID=UPI00230093C7|nr:uncharacterized protein BDF20DRAFT_875222 [Mycotypha africana]KAI8977498.1 hypothetical protein BDF20DRAFT_875222 [Mycotypha africana]